MKRRLLLIIVSVVLCESSELFGESMVSFQMNACADRAESIVVGRLDEKGQLRIDHVIKGGNQRKSINLFQGRAIYKQLQEAMKIEDGAHAEVVAFLGRNSRPVLDWAGVVGIGKDGIYMYQDALVRSGSRLGKHPKYTRESFLAATQTAIHLAEERRRLLAMPRSSERAGKILTFLLKHGCPIGKGGRFRARWTSYHLMQIADGFTPVNAEEERVILEALEGSKCTSERVILLDLIRAIPLTAKLFDVAAGFIERKYPGDVRRSGIFALSRIDNFRAVDQLIPFLSLDDPELCAVLSGLGTVSYPPQDRYLNPSAVEALLRLSGDVRERHREEGRHVLWNESHAVLAQLSHYAHPRLLPIMYEWGLENDHTSCDQALADLQHLTGLRFDRSDKESWVAWWNKASPLLAKRYKLHQAKGRKAWFDAYQNADVATRGILMRLWFYERTIDEKALLKDAVEKDAGYAGAAKTVLSELWQRQRLSPATKKAIVAEFLQPELVEIPSKLNVTGGRELQIVANPDFTFPSDASIDVRYKIAVGAPQPPLRSCNAGGVFQGSGKMILGNLSGGNYLGKPTAKALLEIREVGRKNGNRILWFLRWTLGPIQLWDLDDSLSKEKEKRPG